MPLLEQGIETGPHLEQLIGEPSIVFFARRAIDLFDKKLKIGDIVSPSLLKRVPRANRIALFSQRRIAAQKKAA